MNISLDYNLNMIVILLFIILSSLNTFVFMFQRTTLLMSRESGIPQINLTPNWMGVLGWVGMIGLWGVYILIWSTLNFWWALGAFVFTILVQTLIPIPYSLFKKMVNTK